MKNCILENFNQLADAIVRIENYLGLNESSDINTITGKIKDISEYTLGESIEKYKIVKYIDNKIYKIGNNENLDCNKILGITLESGEIDNKIKILHFGVLENLNWDLNVDKPILLGMNGDIIQTLPQSGFWIDLGKVLSKTKILFNLSNPIIL